MYVALLASSPSLRRSLRIRVRRERMSPGLPGLQSRRSSSPWLRARPRLLSGSGPAGCAAGHTPWASGGRGFPQGKPGVLASHQVQVYGQLAPGVRSGCRGQHLYKGGERSSRFNRATFPVFVQGPGRQPTSVQGRGSVVITPYWAPVRYRALSRTFCNTASGSRLSLMLMSASLNRARRSSATLSGGLYPQVQSIQCILGRLLAEFHFTVILNGYNGTLISRRLV